LERHDALAHLLAKVEILGIGRRNVSIDVKSRAAGRQNIFLPMRFADWFWVANQARVFAGA
jgi:hypothetical protein